MGEFNSFDIVDVSSAFDQDYGLSTGYESTDFGEITVLDTNSFSGTNDVFHTSDPLKHAYKFQFEPLDLGNLHFVEPHYVDGYFRSDGTYVEGYYRDGDGNPTIDRPIEHGGGYVRSNPDGNPFNNLNG
ncbi:hypothetical protein [Pseudalkalibacillus hwajinpoensis]|uniref:Uncharacterized protein n=1 Tax=Guptibacillus hwajinpoensis TaxID=208199 RepID=A0A4U1MJL6_9BACL|nr:hypothetical protein [Pseudalkalibacillus hwajinpoensis]TKD70765.1 hypothetical protein FBF83_09125 [Pseudalkalibacillus hwajinpoensis]